MAVGGVTLAFLVTLVFAVGLLALTLWIIAVARLFC